MYVLCCVYMCVCAWMCVFLCVSVCVRVNLNIKSVGTRKAILCLFTFICIRAKLMSSVFLSVNQCRIMFVISYDLFSRVFSLLYQYVYLLIPSFPVCKYDNDRVRQIYIHFSCTLSCFLQLH